MGLSRDRMMVGRKTPRPFRWIVLIVTGLIAFAVYWSHITILPEIVRGRGQIVPLGALRTIGHFDGGVLQEVTVRPGDEVAAGDVIAVIRQPNIADNIARTTQQIEALEQDTDRLEALLQFLETGETQAMAALNADMSIFKRYQTEQIELYLARQSTLEARVTRAETSYQTSEKVADRMQERIDLARQRKERAQRRYNRGLTTVADLDRETDRLEQVIAEALQADLRTLDARDRYFESLAAVENERLAVTQELTSELYDSASELERLRTELALFEASAERESVIAVEDGTVQLVNFTSTGEVVPPGASIASILPTHDQLVAEVRVNPVDIGDLTTSTPARVALTTFDVRRYGYLQGTILSISPTSELNDRDEPFYEVTVALEKTALAHDGMLKQIRAGMEVSIEFRTEDRSLLAYFIGPVQESLSAAFTERG